MWGRIISTHALTEGDGIVSGLASTGAFQLTPSWRATKTDCSCNSSGHISTHALTEGDRLFSDVFLWINISTHALTEGDDQLFCNAEFSLISTHALTEGDRIPADISILPVQISTHALTEGDIGSILHGSDWIFQLTPSRRATASVMGMLRRYMHFNSRPHGGRLQTFSVGFFVKKFQLTPSRRATASASTPRIFPCHFNSRPHGGRL